MLRDLLARAALGLLAGVIAVSCMREDNSSPENLGEVQQALAGAPGAAGAPSTAGAPAAAGAPGAAGAGGAACDPADCTECEHCVKGACEPYKASDKIACGTNKGACDKDDTCDGTSTCPDTKEPAGTDCGPTLDPLNLCDLQDECDGANDACPSKVRPLNTQCRAIKQGSSCDVAEVCNGTDIDCPPDGFQAAQFPCRPASAGSDGCDVAEVCLGNSPDCPAADLKKADGVSCNSSNQCNTTSSCQSGACVPIVTTVCPAPASCKAPGVCDPGSGACLYANAMDGTVCDDGIACTVTDVCQAGNCTHGVATHSLCQPVPDRICGTFTCDPSVNPNQFPDYCKMTPKTAGTQCRAAGGVCGLREDCDGSTADCPADQFEPNTKSCQFAACTNATATPEVKCTGNTATCPTMADASCLGYACDGTACGTSCADSADCAPTHYCVNNTCEVRIGAGSPCQTDAQCTTSNSHCVDGLCCDTLCDDQCEACDVTGSEGTCSAVTGEPHGDRPACEGDGSACNGVCSGALRSACEFPDPQTVCQDAACDADTGVAVEQAFCDGVGSCATTDPVDCAPFVCAATACRGDCVSDAQCAAGAFCKAGVCTPTQDPGEKCARDGQCTSGFCADGVCCDARCAGQCEACNAAGKCAAISGAPSGMRPACAGDDGDVCAGACDGSSRTACAYPGAAVSCRDAACADGEATVAANCSGAGACAPAQTVTCPNGCEGAICAGDACLVNSDCKAAEHCVAGVCVPQGEPGGACASAGDCASGFCVDGVCCDSACDGQCEACDGVQNPGVCAPVDGAPHGSRPPCSSDGSTCGGTCDGDEPNGCSYPSGTVCAAGSCMPGQNGSEAVATVEAQCNGTGRCPASRQQACGGAGCDAAEQLCNGDCADGSACPGGEYCSAGICVTSEPNGGACQADAQCASGHCVDGYCCSSACDDRCAACDLPGQLGKCSPVSGNTHGGRPGCQGGGVCGAQCDGVSVAACAFPEDDTSCGEPYCHDGTQVAASACDGAGQCRAGEQTACPAFACDGDQCSDACETDADCTRAMQCSEGKCIEPYLINAVDEGTCGCRAPGTAPSRHAAWLALAAASLLALTRRRRGRAHETNEALR